MTRRFVMGEKDIPRQWFNVAADLPSMPPPPPHPGTRQPVGPDDLAPLFPMQLILQEVSQDRFIPIPEPILDVYAMWRPTPLYRATAWEQALGTDCRIFYKYEGVSPAGSHKPNTSIPQAWYNAQEGVKRITTETGAGQWGSALSLAGLVVVGAVADPAELRLCVVALGASNGVFAIAAIACSSG